MGELEPRLFNELKRNKFSGIQKFTEEDVAQVWESVSRFVERQMAGQKGVNIPGLGTFTFSQRSLDVGHGKHIVVQRPVFQLAEKFAQTHALNYTKHYVTGQIPILQLNFTAIASETPYPREAVESCIKEVLQALSRSLHVKKNVEFLFSGIGCLSLRDAKVKMKFSKEFVKTMDNTGQLVNALRNRPDTSDSVLSDIHVPTHRPATGNTVVLPRITLSPKDGNQDNNTTCESRNAKRRCQSGLDKSFNTMATIEEINEKERLPTPVIPSSPKSPTRQPPVISDIKQDHFPPGPDNPNEAPQRPLSSSRGNRLQQLSQPPRTGSGLRSNKSSNRKGGVPMSPDLQVPTPRNNPESNKKLVLANPRLDTGCCHSNKAGQELCYLCHQRSRKNIPIYFTEEKRKNEQEEDQFLQQYQHNKDVTAILNEQAKNFANRKLNQETAAFNLGVSEAIKEKKNARPAEFNRSYLFRHRSLTPPHYLKRAQYAEVLAKQVKEKNSAFQLEKSNQDFLERLEQVQLAEDLARQREQYLQEKQCDKEHYCEALNTQVQFKPLPIPAAEPDSDGPIFGIHDATPEKMKEKRERARKLYQEQLAMVADKKRAAILRDLTAQREESEMLERTKREMQLDRNEHFKEAMQIRQSLEKSWAENSRRKKLREEEESVRVQSPGMLIQEQCDKYHRCDQCGRRPWNCGESNIWRESRYITGSRLIV